MPCCRGGGLQRTLNKLAGFKLGLSPPPKKKTLRVVISVGSCVAQYCLPAPGSFFLFGFLAVSFEHVGPKNGHQIRKPYSQQLGTIQASEFFSDTHPWKLGSQFKGIYPSLRPPEIVAGSTPFGPFRQTTGFGQSVAWSGFLWLPNTTASKPKMV